MQQMMYALIPIHLAAIYFFGWRTLLIVAAVDAAGFLFEYIFARVYKQQVSSAVFVTNALFALSLPPTIPIWIAILGIAFGIVFGKMVFGGFGRNIFNPAITGRAFVYVSFGVSMTGRFIQPVTGGVLRGFAVWAPSTAPDVLTSTTPLAIQYGGESVPWLKLLLGNTSGSMGETCAVLIILTGLYLVIRKTASFRIILGGLLAYAAVQAVFWLAGLGKPMDPLHGIVSGSLLYGLVYMATDPISSSQTTEGGRWIFGCFVGALIALIRTFSSWPEAVTFAILIANMFAPLLDYGMKQAKQARAGRAKPA
ncbi:MAG: RnfABCDGE type electron transport complex subunit D [Spirochaetales bacterium]|nr:MAG: RnfABCDGE type electron transport complex subunit D [Spirochaetales bacterium]